MVSARQVLGFLLGVVVLVAALAAVAQPVQYTLAQQQQVQSAEQTNGTVQNVTIEGEVKANDDDEAGSDFVVVVEYRYTVDGETYTGSSFEPPGSTTDSPRQYGTDSRAEAREFASEYSVNDSVTVYYVPDDPEVSFLSKETVNPLATAPISGFAIFPVLLGALLLLTTTGVLRGGNRAWWMRFLGFCATFFPLIPIVGLGAFAYVLVGPPANLAVLALVLALVGFLLSKTYPMLIFGSEEFFDESDASDEDGSEWGSGDDDGRGDEEDDWGNEDDGEWGSDGTGSDDGWDDEE